MGRYIDNPLSGQAFPSPNLSENHRADLIEQFRASERGDLRVIAAQVTIERECAELEKTASADPIPQPVAADTADTLEDRSVDLCAISAYRRSIRMTGREPARYENYPPKSTERRCAAKPRRVIKPVRPARIRPSRARAVHSHASHSARKRDDSGGEAARFLRGVTLADMQNKETWPKLRGVALVIHPLVLTMRSPPPATQMRLTRDGLDRLGGLAATRGRAIPVAAAPHSRSLESLAHWPPPPPRLPSLQRPAHACPRA